MLAHCNLKQNMCSCSKQSSLVSFYALPSGGKFKPTTSVTVFVEISTLVFGSPLSI